ncbi:M67 family metallopeptidase [Prochlorococcus marinus]|uniref:M67 family metallopeptidase n=1 Tax=Prochlorococcus marinus TaxID=1219 RepID=UPI0022B43D89|nr:M67 family metallopeptidase [Prochlorococcus marinus]
MKIPKYIEFHNETNCVLSRFLKEAEPEEGCCMLIGKTNSSAKDHKKNIWEVTHIWNCRNIWGEKDSKLIDQNIGEFSNQKNMQLSKKNRFEVDAKDQIASHKWSREHDLEVLCSAHSHPSGENKPSEMDLFLHQSPGLMVISNRDGDLKAWWVKNKLNFQRVKIKIFSLT